LITVIQATARVVDEYKDRFDIVVDAPGLTQIITIPRTEEDPIMRAVWLYARRRAPRYKIRAMSRGRFEMVLETV
jgi:hypothetical protein